MTAAKAIYHRVGTVLEILSTLEKRNPKGRTFRYAKCRVRWEDGGEPVTIELSETYTPGQQTAVIYRGSSKICDINLATGKQSPIGDRVEGLMAFALFLSVPLCFVLIGIPIYYGIRAWSRVSTDALRKKVAVYIEPVLAELKRRPAPPLPHAV